MAVLIILALALCAATQSYQQFYQSNPFFKTTPSLQLTGPGAAFAKVLAFNPPERLSSGGFGNASPVAGPVDQTCGFSAPFCPKTRYRSFEGFCNNLQNPSLGMANYPFARLTPYNYADGVSALTRSSSGRPLPNPRELSLRLSPHNELVDPLFNLNAMQWGQIVAHDMSRAVDPPRNSAFPTVCCDENGQLAPDVTTNPTCAPILIPRNDPVLRGIQCINFIRTGTTRDRGCTPRKAPAQPMNGVSSYMDLSVVYGDTNAASNLIRTMSGGRLLTLVRNGQEWPPQDGNITGRCLRQSLNEPCYISGDGRSNQNTQLTLLQVMFLREHNRIADVLAHLNPYWNDETIFQEARRILIAQYQHISFYEYLPLMLGFENMVQNKLIYQRIQGYVNDYNPGVDPTILDEHTNGAFRHFHTLIRGYLHLVKENRQITSVIRLSDWFLRPLVLEIGDSFEQLARGLTTQHCGFSDQYMDSEITQYLFRGNNTVGGDLRARDIQRARTHGMGSYITTRAACGLPVPNSFKDMLDYISASNVAVLQEMYESPQDVDLMVAGSLERNVPGALSGPTFLCIMTEQFYRTRVGDRFFYENGLDQGIAFTPSQLQAIREGASVARLLCDNVQGIQSMQPQAFMVITPDNPLTPCADLPFIDLTLWQDTRDLYKK